MKSKSYIIANPDICHGKPVFAGTRIPVSLVLELLEAGETINEILESYPSLSKKQIEAALHFASEFIDSPGIYKFR